MPIWDPTSTPLTSLRVTSRLFTFHALRGFKSHRYRHLPGQTVPLPLIGVIGVLLSGLNCRRESWDAVC